MAFFWLLAAFAGGAISAKASRRIGTARRLMPVGALLAGRSCGVDLPQLTRDDLGCPALLRALQRPFAGVCVAVERREAGRERVDVPGRIVPFPGHRLDQP